MPKWTTWTDENGDKWTKMLDSEPLPDGGELGSKAEALSALEGNDTYSQSKQAVEAVNKMCEATKEIMKEAPVTKKKAGKSVAEMKQEMQELANMMDDNNEASEPVYRMIPVENCKIMAEYQMREKHDQEWTEDIKRGIVEGDEFDPIVVFISKTADPSNDDQKFAVVDGFHRVHAAKSLGVEMIWAEIKRGTTSDAIIHACGANSRHGLNRTQETKRRQIRTLLNMGDMSEREIAKHVNVSRNTVAKVKQEMEQAAAPTSVEIPKGAGTITVGTVGNDEPEWDTALHQDAKNHNDVLFDAIDDIHDAITAIKGLSGHHAHAVPSNSIIAGLNRQIAVLMKCEVVQTDSSGKTYKTKGGSIHTK